MDAAEIVLLQIDPVRISCQTAAPLGIAVQPTVE